MAIDVQAILQRQKTKPQHRDPLPKKSTPGKLLPFSFGASALGWHQIQPFTICPKEYQLARVRRITRRSGFLKAPLSVGLLLHAARAQWFHDGFKGDLWRTAVVEYDRQHAEVDGKKLAPGSVPFATECFEAYVKHWSVRPKPTVLAVEHEIKPKALIAGAPQWAWRGARLDSMEKWKGKVWLGELKSTSSSPGRVHDLYRLNGQTLLQMALWGEEETKEFGPLGGVLLDIIVKPSGKRGARCSARIPLDLGSVDFALKWFRRDFTTWVMQSSLIDWNTTVERRPVCMRQYGPCEFQSLCLRGRNGSNGFVFEDGSPVSAWKPSEGKTTPPWE